MPRLLGVGVCDGIVNEVSVRVYDREGAVCDSIRHAGKMDPEVVSQAIRSHMWTRPRTSTDSRSTPDCFASSGKPRAWWGCGCSGQHVPVCARQAETQGPTFRDERCQSSRQAVRPKRMALEPSARLHCGFRCTPCSACGCSDFGIWALHWTSQSDDKTALRRDRPIRTMRSRGLSSLPEDQMVFSPTCR